MVGSEAGAALQKGRRSSAHSQAQVRVQSQAQWRRGLLMAGPVAGADAAHRIAAKGACRRGWKR